MNNSIQQMDNKFFDFEKAKVQQLTLEQLRRTHKENDVYGNPLRGIYHYELFQQIIQMANEQNYNVEVYDMFAAQNKDRNTPGVVLLPQVEEMKGERAVEAHILRRVFANYVLLILTMMSEQQTLPLRSIKKVFKLALVTWLKFVITNACLVKGYMLQLIQIKGKEAKN